MVYTTIGATAGTNGVGHWQVNRPKTVKPKIIGAVEEDGKTFYIGENGKQYLRELFDRMWGKPVEKVERKKRSKRVKV